MIIIGLTGSIGMGKSTVAAQFAALGVPVCSADAIVHALMRKGGAAVAEVGRLFPDVVKDGAVDRKMLGEIVFADKAKLGALEHILHPLVTAQEERFADIETRKGAKMCVLEIPLLYETGAQERCDIVVVASAPFFLQKQRVMKRPNMTEVKFRRIVAAQMPDREKRERADLVVPTGLGKAHSFRIISHLTEGLWNAK